MLIIVDKKLPEPAKARLRESGWLLELETIGITYDAISGHPDIFFTQIDDQLIIAPNLPEKFKTRLLSLGVEFLEGSNPVGTSYPHSAIYNAAATSEFLVHNLSITDSAVLNFAGDKTLINVKQGYTRCNLVFITHDRAISSDLSICKKLSDATIKVLHFDPKTILLPGFGNGFFGGCCGVFDKKLWLSGNLKYHQGGQNVKEFVNGAGLDIIELYDGPLFDAGSIFFIITP